MQLSSSAWLFGLFKAATEKVNAPSKVSFCRAFFAERRYRIGASPRRFYLKVRKKRVRARVDRAECVVRSPVCRSRNFAVLEIRSGLKFGKRRMLSVIGSEALFRSEQCHQIEKEDHPSRSLNSSLCERPSGACLTIARLYLTENWVRHTYAVEVALGDLESCPQRPSWSITRVAYCKFRNSRGFLNEFQCLHRGSA